MRQNLKNIAGFTLTELIISIVISVMILGGIFFFISETLLGLARNSSQSDFLKSFYTFSAVFESGEFEILSTDGYHIGLLESPSTGEGIIIGVVDIKTLRLISPSDSLVYLPAVISYRSVSSDEITNLRSDISSAYSLDFQRDTVFDNFFIYSLELQAYNSGGIHELELMIFPQYYESQYRTQKSQVRFDEIFTYSLVF